MPESPSQPEPDWQSEQRARRIAACRAQCGLTEREIQNARKHMVVDGGFKVAYDAAFEFADTGGFNLLLTGDPGRGKTRLAQTVVLTLAEKGVHAKFWTATKFLMTLRAESIAEGSNELIALKSLTSPKVLVLDDFGANKETPWSYMMMDMVIDDWYREGRTGLVITSNLSIEKIGTDISDRIASRLAEMCRVFELKGKDWRV
jgi:DNA replication protein DnaC